MSNEWREFLSSSGRPFFHNAATKQSVWERPAAPSTRLDEITNGLAAMRVTQSLATSDISIVSHAHGRERRGQRGITRRELQEAIKHGKKDRANPGRNDDQRWRYTYQGVVYITDNTSRHEITSWRLDGEANCPDLPGLHPQPQLGSASGGGGGGGGVHIVVVVDASGSMNKSDVPGCSSRRIGAVYDCLASELVDMQLQQFGGAGSGRSAAEVSLIEFRGSASVLFERYPVSAALSTWLRDRAVAAKGGSHGNYLPALDAALGLLSKDSASRRHLFLIFLSDGAPSDNRAPAPAPSPLQECLARLERIGNLVGRERIFVGTVAFGPSALEYDVLRRMAAVLPRGSFQKLGLSLSCLRTAFSSLTSSLTSMRTEAAGGAALAAPFAPRADAEGLTLQRAEASIVIHDDKWDIYCGPHFVSKQAYRPSLKAFVAEGLKDVVIDPALVTIPDGWIKDHGVAITQVKFAEGAERQAFQCSEVVSNGSVRIAVCVGPRLVAKEAKSWHNAHSDFHTVFCKVAAQAEELALLFNSRLKRGPASQLHFVQCSIVKVRDARYEGGIASVIVEAELEGRWTKWNNNAGAVAPPAAGGRRGPGGPLDHIAEDDGSGAEDDGEGGDAFGGNGCDEDVPQCFSHFTFDASDRQLLVCDLQGVWNATDGFTLSDPVIHRNSGGRQYGATDKGSGGVTSFFATHRCNALCRQLGL